MYPCEDIWPLGNENQNFEVRSDSDFNLFADKDVGLNAPFGIVIG
jgi:hypothetical protein